MASLTVDDITRILSQQPTHSRHIDLNEFDAIDSGAVSMLKTWGGSVWLNREHQQRRRGLSSLKPSTLLMCCCPRASADYAVR